MAASDEWTEWYLTPTGWVSGEWKSDFKASGPVLPPAGWVKKCRVFDYWGSVYGGHSSGTEVLAVRDAAAADELEARFGPCPDAWAF